MTTEEMIKYDQTVEFGIATPREINLVRNVLSGSWDEVLDSICYARTGLPNISAVLEYEDEEEDESLWVLTS